MLWQNGGRKVNLPDENVCKIVKFLLSKKSYILGFKYHPPSGSAPWGDVESQVTMRSELNRELSDDKWGAGVDRQTKIELIEFYHHVLNNIDLFDLVVGRAL